MNWGKIARKARVPLGLGLAAFLLVHSRPTWQTLLAGLPFVLVGLAIRAYAAGTLRKSKELAVTGPYAYTRNPLYLGSGVMAAGLSVAGADWCVGASVAALVAAVYVPTILSEEDFLRARHPAFRDYEERVPRLLPRLTPAPGSRGLPSGFSASRYVLNREYRALAGTLAILAVLSAKAAQ